MAPVDTYVDPSKASDANSPPLTAEKSQGQKESDSSDAVSAAVDGSKEGSESEGASGNPEGQTQSGNKDLDREKKRGSPRGHDQNRNRARGVCGKELTLYMYMRRDSECLPQTLVKLDALYGSVTWPTTHPLTSHNTVHSTYICILANTAFMWTRESGSTQVNYPELPRFLFTWQQSLFLFASARIRYRPEWLRRLVSIDSLH